MLTKKSIGFLGAGNMAEALISGLIASKSVSSAQISASDTSSERLLRLAEKYDIRLNNKNYETVKNSSIVFLTVKPADVGGLLRDVAPDLAKDKLIISVAAGVTTDSIAAFLAGAGVNGAMPVIRAMPNMPATVREGVTALFAGSSARAADLKLARAVFECVGSVVVLPDERLMAAVTGLSGSGPAYAFLFMEALAEAGVRLGIEPESARVMAVKTLLGAARLAMESQDSLSELRKKVSSPGGTTVEGLKKLDSAGFKDAIVGAVEAATRRAEELSKG